MNSAPKRLEAEQAKAAKRRMLRSCLFLAGGILTHVEFTGLSRVSAADIVISTPTTTGVAPNANDNVAITETGSISVTGSSQRAVNALSGVQSITNNGTISTSNSARAFFIEGPVGSIVNHGTINGLSNGRGMYNASTISNFLNTGSFMTFGTTISQSGSGALMNLRNSGLIRSTNNHVLSFDGTLHLDNTDGEIISNSDGFKVINMEFGSIINSNGIIKATGDSTAILLNETLSADINNVGGLISSASSSYDDGTLHILKTDGFRLFGGTIENTALSTSAAAVVVSYDVLNGVYFDNVNIISDAGIAGSGNGVSLNFYHTSNMFVDLSETVYARGRMINDGDVDLRTSATIFGDLDFTYGSPVLIEVRRGLITGDVMTGAGNDVFVIRDGVINGNISLGNGLNRFDYYGGLMNGDISFGNGTNQLRFFGDAEVDQQISVASGGFLDLSVHSGAEVALQRTIDLATGSASVLSGGHLHLADGGIQTTGIFSNLGTTRFGINQGVLAGSMSTGGPGRLTYDVRGQGNSMANGQLHLAGGAADLSNQTIEVNYLGGSVSPSTRSRIAEGIGLATLPTDPTVTDNSLFHEFGLERDSNEIYLVLTQSYTAAELANTRNNQSVGEQIQSNPNNDTTLNQVFSNLSSSSNIGEMNEVLESTLPQIDNSNVAAAAAMTGAMFELADGQLAMVNSGGQTGVASGNRLKGMHYWTQGFGGASDQFRRFDVDGYKSDVYGLAVGGDTRNLADDTTLGLSFGYSDTNVRGKSVNRTQSGIESYQIMLYGNHFLDEETFLTGMGVIGWSDNDQQRFDVGGIQGLNAISSYHSWVGALRGAYGKNLQLFPGSSTCDESPGMFCGLLLTPQVFYEYIHFDRDGYTETGAGGAGLAVGRAQADTLNLGSSLGLSRRIRINDCQVLRPDIRLSYRWDVADGRADTFASFVGGGSTFGVGSLNPANSTYGVGSSLKMFDARGWDLTLNYDFLVRTDYVAHAGFARLGYEF